MSEYQYYEFRALDRQLTQAEMDALRAVSTRATITPTSFVNVYDYGDFRGDPVELMKAYFDAFVYVTNWGTNQLMFRAPIRLLDPARVKPYLVEHFLQMHRAGSNLILDFLVEDEEFMEWEEGEGRLPALLPVREEIMAGDLRALYLGWLSCAQFGVVEEDAIEPPVPPGLADLSPGLKALADFLMLDEPLITAAGFESSREPILPTRADLQSWIRALDGTEKDALLLRLLVDEDTHLRPELLRRFHEDRAATRAGQMAEQGKRTVLELLEQARDEALVERLKKNSIGVHARP